MKSTVNFELTGETQIEEIEAVLAKFSVMADGDPVNQNPTHFVCAADTER